MATMTAPVTVSAEAVDHIALLGMQREFERIVDHLQQQVIGLRAIDVSLEFGSDEDPRTCVILAPILTESLHRPDRPLSWELAKWFVTTFPPEVCVNFVILPAYEADDAG